MLHYLPFLTLVVFLVGWAPGVAGPPDTTPDEPTLTLSAPVPDAHDEVEDGHEGDGHGNIDPAG